MKKITEIWIDATDFTQKGGWKEDTQFVHLMGSGYLIAADIPGVPVDDATVTVNIPHKDTYRIWIRDRNWYRPYNPGTFTLLVNGQGNGITLGAMPSDAWVWEIAGDYELESGDTTLALHDLTGYFGRCASILITNDFDYTPSREIERIHKDRARIRGLSTEEAFGGQYDVIVAGGGPGGVPAAIAAARKGMKTLLIHNRPMLGGNASTEVGITMDGASVVHINARETGIAEEIRQLRDRDPSSHGDWTRAMETLAAAEKDLTVLYNCHVCYAQMATPSRIRGVVAQNILDLTKTRYEAKVFIDCTGDGWLGYYAGAKYRFGREASWQHGEILAPDSADTQTMSGCIKSGNLPFFFKTETPVEYHAPEWVPPLPKSDKAFGRRIPGNGAGMHWWIELPNIYDDMYDAEQSRDALLMAHLGYYDHIKNHWSNKEKARNILFRFTSVFVGRRESRRLIGDYVLTQEDCFKTEPFEDAVAYTGWHLDIHHPEGIYSGEKGPMYCAFPAPMPTVPFRCLYSANIDNLLFAGRNISTSHIALGTVRVENSIATFGQAVGTAAAMCIRYDTTPRMLCSHYMKELQQQLLRDDQFIPGIKNEDAEDPCLTATATASSVKTDEIFQTEPGVDDEWLPLDEDRGMLFCLENVRNGTNDLYVRLRSDKPDPTPITMHAFVQGHSSASFYEEKAAFTATAMVPPSGEHWVKVPIGITYTENKLFARCFVRVWIEKIEGISWLTAKQRNHFDQAGIRKADGQWKLTPNWAYRCTHIPPVEKPANCSPQNVVNGWSRILDTEHYEWVSDPTQGLPQWLTLNFKAPAQINSVSIVFDTDLSNPGTCWHSGSKSPGAFNCVKSYEVEIFDGNSWMAVAAISDNFMRKRNHTFEPLTAEAIRITVTETWGDPSARIMEVRASLEN